ncbi:hypothetical protein [Methylobacterium sp.]|uniref:hypothetical protein n=1 Tax=Methylobacterium sp. TaxID=409 RepID=UPI000C3CEBE0|nr:hypothetical protein [Methylobacterium sp.]MBP27850.1 hypothetical protein [Methylobacterium sp.]
MPYDIIHGPSIVQQDVTNSAPGEFEFSGSDAAAVVAANGYITDGVARRMKVGSRVRYTQISVNPPVVTLHEVLALNANGSIDLSDGTTLATTNAG